MHELKALYSRVHGQIHLAAQFTGGVLSHFQNAPWKAGFLVLKGQKMRPPCNSKTKTQRSELKWLLKYLIIPNFYAKFQPNRLATTFGPWNTFTDKDTFFWPPFLSVSPFLLLNLARRQCYAYAVGFLLDRK